MKFLSRTAPACSARFSRSRSQMEGRAPRQNAITGRLYPTMEHAFSVCHSLRLKLEERNALQTSATTEKSYCRTVHVKNALLLPSRQRTRKAASRKCVITCRSCKRMEHAKTARHTRKHRRMGFVAPIRVTKDRFYY